MDLGLYLVQCRALSSHHLVISCNWITRSIWSLCFWFINSITLCFQTLHNFSLIVEEWNNWDSESHTEIRHIMNIRSVGMWDLINCIVFYVFYIPLCSAAFHWSKREQWDVIPEATGCLKLFNPRQEKWWRAYRSHLWPPAFLKSLWPEMDIWVCLYLIFLIDPTLTLACLFAERNGLKLICIVWRNGKVQSKCNLV